MKRLIIFTFFIFATNAVSAQFGLHAGVRLNADNNWKQYFPNSEFLENGYSVGIDYWFRLKNRRVEFTPELAFTNFQQEIITSLDDAVMAKSRVYSLLLNTNIYFLDLDNDCNCPTWSKSNDLIKSGLFLQLTPGVNYFQNSLEYSSESSSVSNYVFSLGAGLGLDIGLSNLVTITPKVGFHYLFNASWNDLSLLSETPVPIDKAGETTDLKQFYAGLRIGIRLDKRNYAFR